MAELTATDMTADPCCAPEQQATCCEPSAKADCCANTICNGMVGRHPDTINSTPNVQIGRAHV